jgi:membrane protease YdiL (CAAX protease family)
MSRLPVIVRAVLMGVIVGSAGTLPWALLVKWNYDHSPAIPWSIIPAALYLAIFWRYVRRQPDARVNSLSEEVWSLALFAGFIGLIELVLLFRVINRLVLLPAQSVGADMSHVPFLTLFLWLVMGSIFAGVVEEVAFRGYMQGPIEKRHGPIVAILVTGIFFGFAHFSHPETTLGLMPFYMAVALIYGGLAYLTNSIWPGMVLHAGGDIMGGLDLVTRGQSEWQTAATPAPLVWQSGTDPAFWLACGAVVVVGAAAVWAYANLAAATRRVSAPARSQTAPTD